MSDTEESNYKPEEIEEVVDERNENDHFYKQRTPSHVFVDNKGIKRQKSSSVWSKFTILSHERSIASCNICNQKLSYKTTVSNLKKHIIRKHHYNTNTYSNVTSYQSKKGLSSTRPSLSELGGLDGLILNVVADEGEDPIQISETDVETTVVYQDSDAHDYCIVGEEIDGPNIDAETLENQHHSKFKRDTTNQSQQSNTAPSRPYSFGINDKSERLKKNRIMDLQLQCLEIKKYNMQMEALILENQLRLPRSIFTQTLQNADTVSRGTQTDVGGSNTKVLYVSDSRALRGGSHHILSFQSLLDD